jgi:uncharacterized protein (DUF3084 family)
MPSCAFGKEITMTVKTRSTLPANPSKQTEVDWLREVAAEVPAGSYMSSFLRPDAVEWVANQIKDDVSPDLFGALAYEQKEHAKTGANMRVEYEAHKAGWQKKLEAVEKDAMTAKADLARCADEVLSVREDLDNVRETCAVVIAQRDQLLRETAAVRSELEDAQVMVRDLKAKILDLLVASGTVYL